MQKKIWEQYDSRSKIKTKLPSLQMRITRIDSKFYRRILSSPRGERTLFPNYISILEGKEVIFQSIAVIFQSKCRRDFRGKKNYKDRYRYYHPLDCLIASLFSFSSAIFFIIRSIDEIDWIPQCGRVKDENPWKETRREEDIYFIFFHLLLPGSKLHLSCQRGCLLVASDGNELCTYKIRTNDSHFHTFVWILLMRFLISILLIDKIFKRFIRQVLKLSITFVLYISMV